MYWLSQDDVHTGTRCGRLAAGSGNGPQARSSQACELVGDSLLAERINAQITLCAFTAWTPATGGHLDAQDEQVLQMGLLGQKKTSLRNMHHCGTVSQLGTDCTQPSLPLVLSRRQRATLTSLSHASPLLTFGIGKAHASTPALGLLGTGLPMPHQSCPSNSALLTDLKRTTGSNASSSSQGFPPAPAHSRHLAQK